MQELSKWDDEHNETGEQNERVKKVWVAPILTVFGTVEDLTREIDPPVLIGPPGMFNGFS